VKVSNRDRTNAKQARIALIKANVYPTSDMDNDAWRDGQHNVLAQKLDDMIRQLSRTDFRAVYELVNLFLVVPRDEETIEYMKKHERDGVLLSLQAGLITEEEARIYLRDTL